VPGGDYASAADSANYMIGKPRPKPGTDVFIAYFTPPYAEGSHLWKFSHAYWFESGKEIHASTMIDTLKKKYGDPAWNSTAGPSGGDYFFIWTSTAAKMETGSEADHVRGSCHIPRSYYTDGDHLDKRIGGPSSEIFATDKFPLLGACGDVILAELNVTSGDSASPDTQIVRGYTIWGVSPDVAVKGLAAGQRLTEAASAASLRESSDKAKTESGPQL